MSVDSALQFVSWVIICVISVTKFRSMDAQVLFRSFCAKITQSTTAITSIAIRIANRLRIKRKITIFRHCEIRQRRIVAIPPPLVILSAAKYPNKINPCVAQPIKSFCYFLLSQKVESPLPRHCEGESQIRAKQSTKILSLRKFLVKIIRISKLFSKRATF